MYVVLQCVLLHRNCIYQYEPRKVEKMFCIIKKLNKICKNHDSVFVDLIVPSLKQWLFWERTKSITFISKRLLIYRYRYSTVYESQIKINRLNVFLSSLKSLASPVGLLDMPEYLEDGVVKGVVPNLHTTWSQMGILAQKVLQTLKIW